MHTRLRALALAAALASLVGCGGGAQVGTSLFNVFVGFWVNSCDTVAGGGSERVNIRLSELSDTRLSGSFTVDSYDNASCSGTPVNTVNFTVNQQGTRPVGDNTAVRVRLEAPSESRNDLFLVQGGQLFRGLPSPLDADGFPTLINPLSPLTRSR